MEYSESESLIDSLIASESNWQTGICKKPKAEIDAYLIGYESGMRKLAAELRQRKVIDQPKPVKKVGYC